MKFKEDFETMWQRIFVDKKPTAYARYADGEYALMNALEVGDNTQAFLADKWKAPAYLTKLGIDLKASLQQTDPNYIFAVPSPSQNMTMFNFYRDNIPQNPTLFTFSDLWINSNYQQFREKIEKLNEKVILIASEDAEQQLTKMPFTVSKYVPIPGQCVMIWEHRKPALVKLCQQLAIEENNALFLISAGPLSEVLIEQLFVANKNNRYIDVGSATDEFVHGKKTRPFMVEGSAYYNNTPVW